MPNPFCITSILMI